jgi:hypothetical protein
MMRAWIRLPSPAMSVALIALVVATTGTTYAAVRIGTKQIRDNAVTSPKIRNGGVKTIDLARNSIVTAKILASAVTGLQIKDASVGTADLGNDSVNTAKIRGGAVGNGDLANDAVTSAKLHAGAVGNTDIADGSVTGAKIADSSITAADIKDGEVVEGNGHVLSVAVTLPDGTGQTAILSTPGVGALRASCAAGVATMQWLNSATTPVDLTHEVVLHTTAPTVASANADSTSVAAGASETQFVPNTGTGGEESVTWQASIDAGSGDHVATVWATAAASGANCRLTAQGMATS